MNRYLLLLSVCLLTFFTSFTQDEVQDAGHVAKVTLLNPGVGYELRIANWQTVHAQAFLNLSSSVETNGETRVNFYFDPAVTLQYRYYYNGLKRLEAEKRIGKNSMNYFALVGEAYWSKMPLTDQSYEEDSRRSVSRYGVVWGLQRNGEKHFSLDLNLGLGYLTAKNSPYNSVTGKKTVGMLTFMGQFNIGFWFGGD